MQEVRAAVIGTGVMGRKYAQMIAEGKAGALRLTAVVCRSAGAQQWAKDTLRQAQRKRAGTGTGNEPRRRKKRPCFRHDVPSAPLQKVYAA